MLGYKSSRIAINIDVNNQDIEDSVKEYKYRKEITKKLCEKYNLKCFFAIHPTFYNVKGLNSKVILKLRIFIIEIFLIIKKFMNMVIT